MIHRKAEYCQDPFIMNPLYMLIEQSEQAAGSTSFRENPVLAEEYNEM
jgi:hypothetical protein